MIINLLIINKKNAINMYMRVNEKSILQESEMNDKINTQSELLK